MAIRRRYVGPQIIRYSLDGVPPVAKTDTAGLSLLGRTCRLEAPLVWYDDFLKYAADVADTGVFGDWLFTSSHGSVAGEADQGDFTNGSVRLQIKDTDNDTAAALLTAVPAGINGGARLDKDIFTETRFRLNNFAASMQYFFGFASSNIVSGVDSISATNVLGIFVQNLSVYAVAKGTGVTAQTKLIGSIVSGSTGTPYSARVEKVSNVSNFYLNDRYLLSLKTPFTSVAANRAGPTVALFRSTASTVANASADVDLVAMAAAV